MRKVQMRKKRKWFEIEAGAWGNLLVLEYTSLDELASLGETAVP